MSISVMSAVWKRADATGSDLLILLALADHADEDGRSYPSVAGLARKARLSERGVQTALRSLEKKGLIRTNRNAGPKGCNVYTICTPAEFAPPQNLPPANGDRGGANGGIEPPQHLHPKRHKPSGKRQSANEGRLPHPLHSDVHDLIFRYYRSKNEGVDPEWNGREAKSLSDLLAANPNAPIEHWRRCLKGRHESQVNHAERPSLWLAKLSSFAKPIDRFNQPQGVGHEQSGTNQPRSAAQQRRHNSLSAVAAAFPEFSATGGPGEVPVIDHRELPQPGDLTGHTGTVA